MSIPWKAIKAKQKALKALQYGPPAPQTANYTRHFTLTLEEGLSFIRQGFSLPDNLMTTRLNGIKFRIREKNLRLSCFAHNSLVCTNCGAKADYFAVENRRNEKGTAHMNLWGRAHDGSPLLFSHDHTIPKSKGGPDVLENITVMCVTCNQNKSDKILDTSIDREAVAC